MIGPVDWDEAKVLSTSSGDRSINDGYPQTVSSRVILGLSVFWIYGPVVLWCQGFEVASNERRLAFHSSCHSRNAMEKRSSVDGHLPDMKTPRIF